MEVWNIQRKKNLHRAQHVKSKILRINWENTDSKHSKALMVHAKQIAAVGGC